MMQYAPPKKIAANSTKFVIPCQTIFGKRPIRKLSPALLVDLFLFTYTRIVYMAGLNFRIPLRNYNASALLVMSKTPRSCAEI